MEFAMTNSTVKEHISEMVKIMDDTLRELRTLEEASDKRYGHHENLRQPIEEMEQIATKIQAHIQTLKKILEAIGVVR